MRLRETTIHYLDENGKAIERWSTKRLNNHPLHCDKLESLPEFICKREGVDKSRKFLIEIRAYGRGGTYYFYNQGGKNS